MAVESTFTMNLDVTGETQTDSAANSLARLALQIKEDRSELGAMQAALKNLAGSTNVAGETIQALKDKIAIHKIVVADAQAAYIALGGTFKAQAKRVEESAGTVVQAVVPLKSRLDELSEAAALDAVNKDLHTLQRNLVADTLAVRKLKQAIAQLGPETTANAGLLGEFKDQLAHVEARIGAGGVRFAQLGGSLNDVAESVKRAQAPTRPLASSLSELAGSAALLPGPLSTGVSRLSALAALMKAGGLIAGMLALGAALVAVAAGVVSVTVAFISMSLRASAARRENELLLQGVIATNKQLKGQQDTWKTLDSTIEATAFRFKTTTDRVQGLAEKLYQGGLRGRFLQTAITAATTAALAGGDEAASAVTKQAIAIGNAAGAMDRFGAKVEKNMGTVARARALSLSEQFARLTQNVTGLFEGAKLDAFATQFARIVDLFDKGTATGQGLRAIFGDLFQGLVDDATSSASGFEVFIKRVVLFGLNLRIEYYKLRNGVRDALKGSWFDLSETGITPLKAMLFGLAAVATIVAAPFVVLAAALGLIVAAFGAVFVAGIYLGKALSALIDVVPGLAKRFGAAAVNLGKAIVGGIAEGIKAAAGLALDALDWLGDKMLSVFKTDNEIHSPSAKWGRESGEPIPAGVGVGVKRATPQAVNAVVSMSDAVAAAFRQGGGTEPSYSVQTAPARGATPADGGLRGGGGRSVSVGDVHIEIKQVPPNVNAAQLASQVWELFVEKLEESASMSGAYSG